jgi:hypothetical protein
LMLLHWGTFSLGGCNSGGLHALPFWKFKVD